MSKGANGTGTVYKPKHPSKNFPFRAEIWITDFSRPNGKRRISKNFKRKTEAEKWRDDMLSKYGKTDHSLCNPMITLSEWLTFWLKNFTPNIKDSTRTGYKCYIEQHISKHHIGKINLKDLNVCDLQSYISCLTSSGNLKNDSGLSTKTIRSMMLMIKKSLHTAVGADIINKNPAEYIILPKLQQRPVEYLTLEQIRKLINVSRGERWGIFFPLAFMTACRIGELGALRKSSLKHENGIYYLSIEGSLNRVKDFSGKSNKQTVLRIGSTKNSKPRQIPIPEELAKLLHQHFEKQKEEATISCGQYLDDPYIFCNEFGNFVDTSTLRNWSKKIASEAGIDNFYPHLLRKSYATLASTNMDIKNLSAILGHSSCNVSTQYYIASDINTKNIAMKTMKPFYDELLG